jgi:hypothetical protein
MIYPSKKLRCAKMKKVKRMVIIVLITLFSTGAGVVSGQSKTVSPIQNLYYHLSDDDGTTPIQNTDVILLFEPNGRALFYVQSTNDQIAYQGIWLYSESHLRLQFDSTDIVINTNFALNLNEDEVNMPFRIFSSGKGTSRWRRQPVVLEHAVRFVFRGEVLNRTETIDADTAIARAVDYANAVIQTGQEVTQSQTESYHSEHIHGPSDTNPYQSQYNWGDLPKRVRPLKNGIEVEYQDGTKVEVLLFSWSPPPPGALVLTPKKLVNDPRVHLNAEPSNDSSCDPDNKMILFISPFNSTRVISWFDGITSGGKASGVVPRAMSDDFAWEQVMARLEKRGYRSQTLWDDSVTVERLIKIFTDLKDPGIVVFYSHGASSGSLCTGEKLTETDDPQEARKKLEEVKERLRRAGHRRLIESEGIGMMSVELNLKVPKDSAWFVTIKPPFWRYIQTLTARPVTFKKSLFFTAACYTDSTEHLRNAIRAKAYFAWKISVSPQMNGATFHYLMENLIRHTHSAEEAYYNLVRVVNTREIIFKEDRILSGKVPASEDNVKSPIFKDLQDYLFNGYGLAGNQIIRYAGNGWLNPKQLDVGQVWWLVFAGRWGQNARTGVENLKDCYKNFWSKRSFGRLKSPFCNAANIGKLPKKSEVAYACYLLTGDQPEGYSGQAVPRWTLNEMH